MTSGAASNSTPLAIQGITHRYGSRPVLKNVSFEVAEGAFTVFLGHNGAGKTTLFSLITRLYNAQAGRIEVFGHDIARQPSAALAAMGVVFQSRTLDLDLSVRQNLHYHAALHGMAPGEAKVRIAEELTRIGMVDRAKDKVRQLSGGQVRRVEIARALIHRPRLLLFDEPTVGLDIGAREGIIEHMHRLVPESRLAMLWATHLIDEVRPGDHVVILHMGEVLAAGPVDEVVAAARATDIRQAFSKLTAGKGTASGPRAPPGEAS
jgi:ABC-2 type transport system ATP-binding protein